MVIYRHADTSGIHRGNIVEIIMHDLKQQDIAAVREFIFESDVTQQVDHFPTERLLQDVYLLFGTYRNPLQLEIAGQLLACFMFFIDHGDLLRGHPFAD